MDQNKSLLMVTFALISFFIVCVLATFSLFGCDPETDGCEPEEARCRGSILEICNADQNWEDVINCLDFEPDEWACCASDGEIGCWKVEECDR